MSLDPNKDKQLHEARVDRAVAEDVAEGMAARADHEAARADVAESEARQQAARAAEERERSSRLAGAAPANAARAEEARAQRDAAVVGGSIAREQARNASFGFWLLLGAIAVVLLIAAIWYANRPPVERTTVVLPGASPTTAPATAPTAPVQFQSPAPAPAMPPPAAAPAPTQPPVIQQERTIIIEQAPAAQPGDAAPGAAPPANAAPANGAQAPAAGGTGAGGGM